MNPLDLIDLCEACYARADFVAGPDGRDGASLFRRQGQSVLVFRGTLTDGAVAFLDWLNDLRAALVSSAYFPGHVHHGFLASVTDLWPYLPTTDLEEGLLITGHSKGGALAIGAGWLLRHLHPQVVTFAAPMFGDRTFSVGLTARVRVTCYENPHDVVPRLPPLGYRSVGDLVGPPIDWIAPRTLAANHHLESGYRPWIERLQPRPPAAQAA